MEPTCISARNNAVCTFLRTFFILRHFCAPKYVFTYGIFARRNKGDTYI